MIDTIKISKVLGDPVRYKILLMLVNHSGQAELCGPVPHDGICNCEIMATFNMIQSRVSYHMKELVDTNLVREVPEGKWKYYFLNKEVLREYLEQLTLAFEL